jgi:hypothetical protein
MHRRRGTTVGRAELSHTSANHSEPVKLGRLFARRGINSNRAVIQTQRLMAQSAQCAHVFD